VPGVPLRPFVLPLALFLLGSGSVAASSLGSSQDGAGDAPFGALLPSHSWAWPVRGPVIRPFDPPDSPYGAGHRGIDIAVPFGTTIVAPDPGTVSFAGRVGGELFVTIDHGGGLASTYSWLSAATVRKGDAVARGQPIGTTGVGHPGSTVPHLHFGVKLAGAYVDPMEFLGPLGVEDFIRLVPLAA
jgi:murein DD-endopeptidase MepM/ murein hydrolase activator NlpD